MTEFRILKLEIDSTYYFFRRETVGSSFIGASGDYKSEDVVAHFRNQLQNKLSKEPKPTRMDKIAGSAKSIKVTVLDTLGDCTVEEADAKKSETVAEYRKLYGAKVLNVR